MNSEAKDGTFSTFQLENINISNHRTQFAHLFWIFETYHFFSSTICFFKASVSFHSVLLVFVSHYSKIAQIKHQKMLRLLRIVMSVSVFFFFSVLRIHQPMWFKAISKTIAVILHLYCSRDCVTKPYFMSHLVFFLISNQQLYSFLGLLFIAVASQMLNIFNMLKMKIKTKCNNNNPSRNSLQLIFMTNVN